MSKIYDEFIRYFSVYLNLVLSALKAAAKRGGYIKFIGISLALAKGPCIPDDPRRKFRAIRTGTLFFSRSKETTAVIFITIMSGSARSATGPILGFLHARSL